MKFHLCLTIYIDMYSPAWQTRLAKIYFFYYFILFYIIAYFMALPTAYGSSQARIESEPQLQPTPQLTYAGSFIPLPQDRDQTHTCAVTWATVVRFLIQCTTVEIPPKCINSS